MKKLSPAEFGKAVTHFDGMLKVTAHFERAPFIYELKAHNSVTIDISPSFANIAPVFKLLRDRGTPVELWKINMSSGRKVKEYINPLY